MLNISIDLDKLTADELAALKYGIARHVPTEALQAVWKAGDNNAGTDDFRYLSLEVRRAMSEALKSLGK